VLGVVDLVEPRLVVVGGVHPDQMQVGLAHHGSFPGSALDGPLAAPVDAEHTKGRRGDGVPSGIPWDHGADRCGGAAGDHIPHARITPRGDVP
jgi:hypothetical protein